MIHNVFLINLQGLTFFNRIGIVIKTTSTVLAMLKLTLWIQGEPVNIQCLHCEEKLHLILSLIFQIPETIKEILSAKKKEKYVSEFL